ncbi:hypothetical protein [Microbulbifer pacificus]|uniref:Uncharacterized protein n=1 Tax=Microbulbifer pacificus TaxID=407164 RepID=A0AAU0N0W6_9GAMM|nr:hypothetical protein [Microbulbifer pacificus]WOX05958.1 hypothetical protein R5R33_02115 [Microbulbifer pacificus]
MLDFFKRILSSDAPSGAERKILPSSHQSNSERKTSIDVRRAILDWRDQFTEDAELQFRSEFSQLLNTFDTVMNEASIRELLNKKFAKAHLEPLYLEWQEREVKRFLLRAEKGQKSTLVTQLRFSSQEVAAFDDSSSGILNLLLPTAATGIGVAAVPSVGAASVVSAGGLLGVFGVTTISWPILLSGLAISTVLVSTGVIKGAKLKDKLREKIRNRVGQQLTLQFLGDGAGSSLVENLQKYIHDVANDALGRL